jgi:flagellar biosynthesis GTPase FlhF
MAEALGQVKQTMGHDAVILHTRTYHTRYMLGLRRREIVEITAGRGSGLRPRRPAQRPAPQQQAPWSSPFFPAGARRRVGAARPSCATPSPTAGRSSSSPRRALPSCSTSRTR